MTEIAAIDGVREAAPNWLPKLVAIGLMSLGVAACSSGYRAEIVGAVPEDYRLNHPITISETLATLDVPVGVETRYLPRGMGDNIAGFGRSFLQSGSDILAIVMPAGSANTYAAAAIATQIEQLFVSVGVPLSSIQYRSYPADPNETVAPVRLAYAEITANAAPCGPWPDNVARNFGNENYANFGCATQYNLAAMIANPLDLLYPRIMTPANAARRDAVLAAYQNGNATDTNYPNDFGGGVAEVGQ